jgi:prepilin-type N-terminal cleavage/methylation domain-containing protein
MSYSPLSSKSGFTLVELIVGMTIFSVGMTAILALLHSTIDTSIASRQEIIASNLLREQIELIKNVRNSNVRSFVPWDTSFTGWSTPGYLASGSYIIENDYTSTGIIYALSSIQKSPVFMDNIILSSVDIESRFNATRLKLDDKERYNHRAGTGTNYASYIIVSPLIIRDSAGIAIEPKDSVTLRNQWYILDARVIAKSRNKYREYDLKTVITDWKK